jgi:M6 family metalloprotease-like protein
MLKLHALVVVCAGLLLAQPRTPESEGVWRGRVEVLAVDNFQTGTSRTRLFLHTPEETLELRGAEGAGLRAGQTVEVQGRAEGGRLTVSHVTAAPADGGDGGCSTTGEQKTLVILASFPSKALLSSVTPTLMSASYFGSGQTVNEFLQEASLGQTSVTGQVVGPVTLDADYFDEPLSARDAALRAAAPSVDLTQYTRFVVVAPQGEMGMDSGGMALIGCGQITTPQGTLTAASMWLGAESMIGQANIVQTAAHEFGHGLGLAHARWADYGTEILGPAGQAPAPWDQTHDYGDSFSDMGRGSGQWAAPHKALLGWLQAGTNIQTVTANGTFTVLPYEQTGGGQALKVSRDSSGQDWLWVEYRQPLGTFDAALPTAAFAGALVHYADPGLTATLSGVDASLYTNLVNFHPAVAMAADPTLHVGETWTDSYGNVSLKVNSASAAGASVTVAYAPAPTCPSSVGNAQAFPAAGGTGTIPVTAGAGCSWSATASVPWISVGSSASGSGNGSVGFTVAANGDVLPRWGKVTVGGAFVIVTQAGTVGSLTLNPPAASFPAAGGTGQIAVATSAPDFAWDLGWSATWITDVECSCTSDVGPATLSYVVGANSGPQRTTNIMIGGLTFTITQDAGAPIPGFITWTQLSPQNAPSARLGMAMAPWGHNGQAILYGGSWDGNLAGDTWLWDGTNWTQLNPAHSPGAVGGHTMVYDEARGNIVLFGGTNSSTDFSNQTWVWDGADWHQMNPATSPTGRYAAAMAYDPVLQKTVLFGGLTLFGYGNDTWTWDGANWTEVSSATKPVARSGHGMAFDALHGNIVMFGGFQGGDTPTWYSDTWLWDATGWHQAPTATPPAPRSGALLAYHPNLHAVAMVGGMGGKDVVGGTYTEDIHKEIWLWNGSAWVQQFPAIEPGPSYTLGAAWDDVQQGLTMHVGDDLTCLSRGPKTFLLTGTQAPPPVGLHFVPVTPCRVADTRQAGGPLSAGATRSFAVPQSSCNIPATAQAYSLNVTAVPQGGLSYLTLWPTGEGQPQVSTLNSMEGLVVANAAIVPAGTNGAVSVYATDPTDVVLDINGYFDASSGASSYSFYTAPPCRVADTRNAAGPFGGPSLAGNQSRDFAVPASVCAPPAGAAAYSMNVTAVPPGPLYYLTMWPAGQPRPTVSTLNAWSGQVTANAAIVPAGTSGSVSVYASDATDAVLDLNGYFAAPGGAGALNFYPVTPCRVADTRWAAGTLGGPEMQARETRTFPIPSSGCNIPSTAQAYSLNVTVVPEGPLYYLTAFPSGTTAPLVSTLNSFDGAVVANAAIVPAGADGGIDIYVTDATQVVLDIDGYFAP